MVTALPLYHIFALTCCFFFFMRVGGCCLLIANPRDARRLRQDPARARRFTHFSGVNTLFNLLDQPPEDRRRSTSRSSTSSSPAAWRCRRPSPSSWKAITGRAIVEGYGLSETSPGGLRQPARPRRVVRHDRLSRCPRPRSRSADSTAARSPAGEPGELCVRGPAGHGRLLEAPGRDRPRHDRRRLLPHRRRGGAAARRAGPHRRPDEGHDPGLGLQRLPERGRGRARRAIRACSNAPWSAPSTTRPARWSWPTWCARTSATDHRRRCGPSPARSSPATRCRAGSSSTTPCRRPMSARCCAGPCATIRRLRDRGPHRNPRPPVDEG